MAKFTDELKLDTKKYSPKLILFVIHHIIVVVQEIKNTDDDQLYYTHVYLDKEFREANKIVLDGTSKIFHNLHGAIRELDFGFGNKRIANWEMGTMPQVCFLVCMYVCPFVCLLLSQITHGNIMV